MKKLLLVIALVSFFAAAGTSHAYPTQPITIISPFAAGGGTDAVARIIATLMQNELGVPVNVVNRDGGGGVVGHTAIAQATPDGYTIGIGTVEMAMLHWMGHTTLTHEDMLPIGGLNIDSAAITVPADRWEDYASLIEYVRANEGVLNASGTTVGGIWHLAMAAWLSAEGLASDHIHWIPSAGAAPAQQEMLAGNIDIITVSLPEVAALVDAGRLTVIAYMGDERNPTRPDVPTLKELGVPVNAATWRGLFGPRGMPENVVQVLEETLETIVASQEFIDFMNSRGFNIAFYPSEEWAEFVRQSDEQFGVVMREAGLVQ